jgi:hypothetical protein
MWAELQGLQGFSFVEDTLGGNKLSRILTRTSQDLFLDLSERWEEGRTEGWRRARNSTFQKRGRNVPKEERR